MCLFVAGFSHTMKTIEAFFLGILAALGSLVLQVLFLLLAALFSNETDFNAFAALTSGSIDIFSAGKNFPLYVVLPAAALLEELFKYLVIVKRVEPFHIGKSVVLHSFLVGLGFATTEIFIISGNTIDILHTGLPYQKLAEVALIHIFTAGIIGFFVALKNPSKFSTAFKAVLAAFFVHLIYNLIIVFPNDFSGVLMAVLLTILLIINTFNLLGVEREFA